MTQDEILAAIKSTQKCIRCKCAACDRDPYDGNHAHICTEKEGCVETPLKQRNRVYGLRQLLNRCQEEIVRLQRENESLREGSE